MMKPDGGKGGRNQLRDYLRGYFPFSKYSWSKAGLPTAAIYTTL